MAALGRRGRVGGWAGFFRRDGGETVRTAREDTDGRGFLVFPVISAYFRSFPLITGVPNSDTEPTVRSNTGLSIDTRTDVRVPSRGRCQRQLAKSHAPSDACFGLEGGCDFLFGGPPVGTLDLGDAVADDVLGWVDVVEASGVASEELCLVVDG